MTNRSGDAKKGVASKKAKAKPSKSHAGRKKEKIQISVRIDKAVMDLAYSHIEKTGDRITDYLERGIILAMQEDLSLPAITSRVRFLVAHADPAEQQQVKHLLALLRMPVVRRLALNQQLWRDTILMNLAGAEAIAAEGLYEDALAEYGHSPTPPSQGDTARAQGEKRVA